MKKHFCELCKKETQRDVISQRFIAKRGGSKRGNSTEWETPPIRIECFVTVAYIENSPDHDLCINCLKDIVAAG